MHPKSYFAASLLGSLAYANPFASPSPRKRALTQISYAALGDSFGAGIGAGTLLSDDGSPDGRNNICARMSKSYPATTETLMNGDSTRLSTFDFLACSGDLLDDIDGQVHTLLGNKPNAVSLSISGNDFGFGKVVAYCVYPYRGMKNQASDPQKGCNDQLNAAETTIGDGAIWEKYRSKIQLIQQSLAPDGHIYITGYARFFSPGGSSSDKCDSNQFFNSSLDRFVYLLKMKWGTRAWMNDLVTEANRRIQADVVQNLGGDDARIHFIDIDSQFNGRRFCERGKNPWGDKD